MVPFYRSSHLIDEDRDSKPRRSWNMII